MAEKQTILGRISQLAKANINALLDRAEDPQKMLDQLIRDYTNSIAEAETAVAQTVGNLRLAEKDHDEDVTVAADWGRKAAAASAKAEEMRAAGDQAGAQKWDDLARVAIGKQIQFEGEAKNAEPLIASQREVVDKLKNGLVQMKDKLSELKTKISWLHARRPPRHRHRFRMQLPRSMFLTRPPSSLASRTRFVEPRQWPRARLRLQPPRWIHSSQSWRPILLRLKSKLVLQH